MLRPLLFALLAGLSAPIFAAPPTPATTPQAGELATCAPGPAVADPSLTGSPGGMLDCGTPGPARQSLPTYTLPPPEMCWHLGSDGGRHYHPMRTCPPNHS